MSSVNVQVSVVNIPQIDRHQNDIHKNPIVHQEQNAQKAHDEIDKKMTMPNETENSRGKIIDPNQKRDEFKKRNKKKKNEVREGKKTDAISRGDEGYFVDIQA